MSRTSIAAWIRKTLTAALVGTKSSTREIPFASIFDDPRMTPGHRIDEDLDTRWADDIMNDRGR